MLLRIASGAAFLVIVGMSIQHNKPATALFAVPIVLCVEIVIWVRKWQMRRTILVDPQECTITFKEFLVFDGLRPRPYDPETIVAFRDVLQLKEKIIEGHEVLRIVMKQGTISIDSDSVQHYATLKELLQRVVSNNENLNLDVIAESRAMRVFHRNVRFTFDLAENLRCRSI